MTLTILSVGKTKQDFLLKAEEHYLKKIAPFFKIENDFVKSYTFLKNQNTEVIVNKENKELMTHISLSDLVVVFDSQGDQTDSNNFAKKLDLWLVSGKNIVLVVGGPFGLDEEIKKRADYKISLSQLTFTHEFAKVLVLEQIYRAFTILKNIPYHY